MARLCKRALFATTVWAVAAASMPAAAQSSDTVAVLGIRSVDGDDQLVRQLTNALRKAGRKVASWKVGSQNVSLSQMTLAHGCEQANAACMAKVAKGLDVGRVVYGTVERTGSGDRYDYAVELHLYDADAGSVVEHVRDTIPRAQSGAAQLRQHARRFVRALAGQQSQKGTLRVSANVPQAAVLIDGERAGTTDAQGTFVASGVTSGSHRIEVRAEGREPYRGTVSVEPGQKATVQAQLPRPAEPASAEPAPASPMSTTPAKGPEPTQQAGLRWPSYLSLGVTAVFAGLLVGSWVKLGNLDDDPSLVNWRQRVPRGINACAQASLVVDRGMPASQVDAARRAERVCNEADTWEMLQWVFLAGALAGGGTAAFFLYRDLTAGGSTDDTGTNRADADDLQLSVTPSFGPHGGRVDARLRF